MGRIKIWKAILIFVFVISYILLIYHLTMSIDVSKLNYGNLIGDKFIYIFINAAIAIIFTSLTIFLKQRKIFNTVILKIASLTIPFTVIIYSFDMTILTEHFLILKPLYTYLITFAMLLGSIVVIPLAITKAWQNVDWDFRLITFAVTIGVFSFILAFVSSWLIGYISWEFPNFLFPTFGPGTSVSILASAFFIYFYLGNRIVQNHEVEKIDKGKIKENIKQKENLIEFIAVLFSSITSVILMSILVLDMSYKPINISKSFILLSYFLTIPYCILALSGSKK